MSGDLELDGACTAASGDALGYVAGLRGHRSAPRRRRAAPRARRPLVLASSNARHFESRTTPRELGLRDVLAVGDALWACGEYGQLAVLARSRRDAGRCSTPAPTRVCSRSRSRPTVRCGSSATTATRRACSASARRCVDFGTTARLARVVRGARRDRRARRRRQAAALARRRASTEGRDRRDEAADRRSSLTKHGTWVAHRRRRVHRALARRRVVLARASGVDVDLEAIASLADGRVDRRRRSRHRARVLRRRPHVARARHRS